MVEGDIERAAQGPADTRIEKVETGGLALSLSDRAMIRFEHIGHESIFEDLKVRLYRLGVDPDISRNTRVIDQLTVALCRNFNKGPERVQLPYQMLAPYLFL